MRLIDADALKEAFYRKMKELLLSTDTPQISNEALSLLCGASLIADAPTIEERKWIPCSERLPEDDTLMLVNYIDSRPDAMDIWIGWHEMENVWYIDGEAHSKEYGNEVIAWMPLPEPYAERGEPSAELNNGIGCSRCGERLGCYDRNMSHAVLCNNYGKITDAERSE